MSFADLTPEAYKAAENAAWQLVRQYGELNLEQQEVYHDALIYLAERPEYVARRAGEPSGYAVRNMERKVREFLSNRLAAEAKRQRQSVSHDDWSERMAGNGW